MKVIQYKRAKLEKWAPYLNSNGLMSRLSTYEDLECKGGQPGTGAGAGPPTCCGTFGTSLTLSRCECVRALLGMGGWRPGQPAWLQPAPLGHTGTKLLEMKEWYQNREDMLELRHIHKDTGLIIDYFKPGHPQALRGEWTPLPGQPGPPAGPSTLLRAAPTRLACSGKNPCLCSDRGLLQPTRCERSGSTEGARTCDKRSSRTVSAGPQADSMVGARRTAGPRVQGGQDAEQ